MSTFDGYFERQFGRRIRADRFTQQDPATVLQLLSHAHADHTVGLSSKDLRGYVYCSAATKDIILRSATASERVHAEVNYAKSDDYYTFRNLQQPVYNAKGKPVIRDGKKVRIDVLKTLELDVRHDFSEYFGSPVAVTLIDANHCPGAVMFLIESPEHAILYTGDVRSEAFLINMLTENPYLQDYLALHGQTPRRTLDQIYLDTSAALSKGRLLPKLEGVKEALEMFDLFPPKTRFFINSWTWGYEELLRAIAYRYQCKIHLDDYKAKIYKQSTVSQHDYHNSSIGPNYPELADIGTSTFQHTRFHACERRWKCPHVRGDGRGCFASEEMQVLWEDKYETPLRLDRLLEAKGLLPQTVFVNPADATEVGWAKYKDRVTAQCAAAKAGQGPWPTNLLVPLARHSSLPELQDLVALFKPHNIYPNTIYPEFKGHDYILLAQYFANTLAPGGKERLARDAREYQRAVAENNGEKPKPPTRMTSPQEEEQTQEVREEMQSKYARISNRLPQEFIISNFDHLDDPNDLDLLIAGNDETQEEMDDEEVEQPVSQELPEVTRPSRRVRKPSSEILSRAAHHDSPPRPKLAQVAATSPAIPSSSNDENVHGGSQGSSSRSKTDSARDSVAGVPERNASWLASHIFCFDADFEAKAEEGASMIDAVYAAGGAIVQHGQTITSVKTAVSSSTAVVCSGRHGETFRVAHEQQKMIGNTAWLAKCLRESKVTDPQLSVLDQPFPGHAVNILKGMAISSTGFDEADKTALATMTVALGGQYLPDLSKSRTTLLVASGHQSKKGEAAQKWRLPVVNFLWLEDCFANGRKMPIDAARYQDLAVTPALLKRRVGCKPEQLLPTSGETDRALAPESVAAPARPTSRPLQPASVKRKQQPAMTVLQDSPGTRNKKIKKDERKTSEKKADMPETFESVSTVHQDDLEQIKKVKEVVQKGLGLPRILSCEIFE